ncbi:MAG: cysteine synthase [Desulfobacteraceae bacterium]|nr:cysteine synthase [Desulfobacteraceae bacterium]
MSHFILDMIGNTPLVEIRRLNPNPAVRIFAKLEYLNPGGSIKDRAALYMIEAGERSGELTPQKTVIEATSGNTGIGLALVCAVKGYRLLLAMSEAVSLERRKILQARGAEILLTPGHLGTDGAIEEVYRLALEEPGRYFMPDQFNNPANWQAHYDGTAPEIWRQTDGKLSMLVATLGTTGTLMGMARKLKEYDPRIQVVGVEPYLGHKLQGLKNMKEAYRPEIFEKERLDEKVNIEDEEAFDMARQLARQEGLFVGMSSGAAMAVARKKAETLKEGVIVAIFPDSGERYLSTPLFAVQEKAGPMLFNTLTRRKEPFESIESGQVGMYTCGPTADRRLEIADWRRFVFADLLYRYLTYRGYAVRHVINITDMDDKTIEGSDRAGIELSEFTEQHIRRFEEDLETLGIAEAYAFPRASQHVDAMVRLADRLVKKGIAYEKLRSLYFDISRYSDYGKLSGIDLDKIKLGATVDLDDYEKDNPRDFTLMKRARLSEMKRGLFTRTDWGNVRPSWHIQCVAMAMQHLGDSYDIHTSGRELIFPHHENEIAIAGSLTGKPLARYWIHCERVLTEKGAKGDSGGGGTVEDVLQRGYTGKELRYWLLSSHYRKPIAFSMDRLQDAHMALKRVNACIRSLQEVGPEARPYPEVNQIVYDLKTGFTDAMDDDLNVSGAMASIFTSIRKINVLLSENRIDAEAAEPLLGAMRAIDSVLNVFDFGEDISRPEVQLLIAERDSARSRGDWDTADRIREELEARGIRVRDAKRQPDF